MQATAKRAETLKAYQVSCYCLEENDIVFAETPGKAKAQMMGEFGCDFTEMTAKRIPEFDRYADAGHVPIQAMLDNDWYFYCYRCGEIVSKDTGEDDPDLAPIVVGSSTVYHKRCLDSQGRV